MTTLTTASRQWAERPADERYTTLAELHDACVRHKDTAATATVPYRALAVQTQGDALALVGQTGQPATLTHWSVGQLAARVGAPAGYLRQLPAQLAADNLNHGLQTADVGDDDGKAKLLLARNGDLAVRAVTSERYTRIWDADITRRLLHMSETGPWQPAPAAFDGSRGLYASDHDLFAFLVDNGRRIFEKDAHGGLSRGFFVWNSETGAATFGVSTFLYEYVCGNHIVWGASQVKELRVRHIGNADERAFRELSIELREYAEGSADEEETRITRARTYRVAQSKDELLDEIFGLRVPALSRKRATEAYALAESHVEWYGDPLTAWGFANGVTELARDMVYADDRVNLERAAGKVLELAF